MKDKNELLLKDYLKSIKETLAYKTFTKDEKDRWDIVVSWMQTRAMGTSEQQMREISAAYFAFVEGIGGTPNLLKRQIKGE